ncbi:MAG: hypothetical protein GQ559_05555, partial [Desulfobulbaceae bacterium]|nr:hypothetical protein [Desulfobulbaceae bacterium]
TRHTVYLQTQFDKEPDLGNLVFLDWFANPASKNGEPMYDKKAHLASYCLYQPAPEPMRTVVLANQFGKQKIIIGRPRCLLAPSMKIEKDSKFPKKLDHYKVFQVLEGEPINKEVKLEDQFDKTKVKITYPYAFAAPAEKRHEGRVFPVQNKKAHLIIYKITPHKIEKSRITSDQFGKHQLNFYQSILLAVPSIKLKWKEV